MGFWEQLGGDGTRWKPMTLTGASPGEGIRQCASFYFYFILFLSLV